MEKLHGNNIEMDPRVNVVEKRLESIDRIIAISGGKGGVGKSVVSVTLAASLTKLGYRTGLLDLDLTGPSAHLIMGKKPGFPEEDKGVIPAKVGGISFSSIIQYAGDSPSPLRGSEISNAIIEILSITRWEDLDFLIIDMPPGIGDTILDIIKLIKRCEFVLVTTQSKVAVETVRKNLKILKELNAPIIGIIENMSDKETKKAQEALGKYRILFLGKVPYDKELEGSFGDIDKIMETECGKSMNVIGKELQGF